MISWYGDPAIDNAVALCTFSTIDIPTSHPSKGKHLPTNSEAHWSSTLMIRLKKHKGCQGKQKKTLPWRSAWLAFSHYDWYTGKKKSFSLKTHVLCAIKGGVRSRGDWPCLPLVITTERSWWEEQSLATSMSPMVPEKFWLSRYR